MRILEIAYSWPAETFIVRHINALKSFHDIDISIGYRIRQARPSSTIQDAVVPGVKDVPLPNFDHLRALHKLNLWIRSYRSAFYNVSSLNRPRDRVMLSTLADLKPDIIHFHTSSLAVMMSRYAQQLHIPYTFSLRGSDVQVLPLTLEKYSDELAGVTENARAIHTVADALAHQLREHYNYSTPFSTIRTCVPFPEVLSTVQQSKDQIRFVSMGRLHWRKAYNDLIRAMHYLPENYILDLVGDGTEREHLTYLIHSLDLERRVILHGMLPYDRIQKLLNSATAYVQTSIAEGFSNALAEAMSHGLPVFATPAGGTNEIITDGNNGILLEIGDPKKIAEKLSFANKPELMRELGLKARETAIREFNEEKHATQFLQFYQSALGSDNTDDIY